MAAKARF